MQNPYCVAIAKALNSVATARQMKLLSTNYIYFLQVSFWSYDSANLILYLRYIFHYRFVKIQPKITYYATIKKERASMTVSKPFQFQIAENIWLSIKPMLIIIMMPTTLRLKDTVMFRLIVIMEHTQATITVLAITIAAIRNQSSVSVEAGSL